MPADIFLTTKASSIKGLMLFLCLITFISCQPEQTDNNQEPKTKEIKSSQLTEEALQEERFILVFGNSLAAGYGLEEEYSFPSLIQKRIDSLGLNYTVVNAGLSGETTSGGNNRIDWVLKQSVDIFILELGGNDVLRGFDLKSTEANLRSIIIKVRKSKPEATIILTGMLAPQNLGEEYTSTFALIYPRLAKEFNTGLIPFLLDDVAAIPELNLPDGIHPNEAGAKIVMENVWRVLEGYL